METRGFREWLGEKNYSERTIRDYTSIVENLPEIRRYEDLMTYIKSLKEKIKPQTINQRLVSIRLYYDYLKAEGLQTINIAHKVKVKGGHRPFLTILKREELEQLYTGYPSRTEIELRRKVLLGILVYQGADLGTTQYLKLEHLALEKSEIYLPSTGRKNSRRLALHGSQILPLYRYLEDRENSLFKDKKHLINQYEALKNDLRKQEEKVENIRQIRISVITNWLNQYNIREVQYYCGHKHIGSTEKYKRVDLEQMKSDLRKYHPLGR